MLCYDCRLMLENMNKVLGVDTEKKQIKVQAQMTLKGLYDAADAAHLSTPRSALPWWQGLTLGGVFSTSSHGTGNNVTHMIVSVAYGMLFCQQADGFVHGPMHNSGRKQSSQKGRALADTMQHANSQHTAVSACSC